MPFAGSAAGASDRAAVGARGLRIAVIGLRGVPGVIGGIETHCERLYPALGDVVPGMDIVVLVRRAYVRQTRFALGRTIVQALPSLHGTGLETTSHTLLALLYARFRIRPDIVHLHGIGPSFFAPLAAVLGLRIVVTHHAADFQRRKWGRRGRTFLKLGEAMAARFADRIVCVSEALARDFLSRHPRAAPRTVTIRHAAHVVEMTSRSCAEVLDTLGLVPGGYVLAVGRLEETKRFDDLIAAHGAAWQNALPLVIVGASIGNTDCEMALRAAAGPGVIFLGFRMGSELTALYRGAAYFIHASEMEGFGLVVLEAIAAGRPIRLSDIPSHREFALPEHDYFAVGDRVAITAIFDASPPSMDETSGYPDTIARYDFATTIHAHADVFREAAAPR